MTKLLLFSLFALIICSACNKPNSDTRYVYLNSNIDKSALDYITAINSKNIELTITSSGGNVKTATDMAKYLMTKNLQLSVTDYCLSACAEKIIPSADQIKFIDHPIIGFHWSPIMNYNHIIQLDPKLTNCDSDAQKQREILSYHNLNIDFWKDVEKRLNLLEYKLVKGDGNCPFISRRFENDFWLPTSKQLQQLWGLKFSGNTCADNFELCKKKVDNYFPYAKRIIIGDNLYISKSSKGKIEIDCEFAKREIESFKHKNSTNITDEDRRRILVAMEKVKAAACQ